jgi:hypothetical protein
MEPFAYIKKCENMRKMDKSKSKSTLKRKENVLKRI